MAVTQWNVGNPGTRKGWSAASISPQASASSPANIGAVLNDPKLATAGKMANDFNTAPPEVQQQMQAQTTASGTPLQSGSSAIGWLNWISQNPVTADQLLIGKEGVNDKKLSTFDSSNSPLRGLRRTDAQVSLFNNPNAPREILDQINSLNMNQSLRRASEAEYLDKLYRSAPDNPVYAESLRAASVRPGSSVAFGERIQSSGEMEANVVKNLGIGNLTQQQATSISNAANVEGKLAELRAKRAAAGSPPMGFYTGSSQEKLDQQIMALDRQASPESMTQQLALRSAGASAGTLPKPSGWTSGGGMPSINYNIW